MSNWIPNGSTELPTQAQLDQLATRVRDALRSWLRYIRIELRDDGITLHGNAYSYYGKQLAQHEVIKATKLPVMANEIRVM